MKKCIIFHLFAFLLFSCQNKDIEKSLIDDFSFNVPLVNNIDDLLSDNVRIIKLDTLTEAFVGNVNKIIKHDNCFYILSDEKRILHFDNNGKFLSTINKIGGGPDEYSRLMDFDIYNSNGNTEIWIRDYKAIKKYELYDNEWNFKGNIDFDFVINKFKIISDNHIIFVTGQNEEILMLTDITGNKISGFLKKEIPFIIERPIQFINYDSCIVFQLGISNECVALDTKKKTFEHINITNNENFYTSKNLLDLFDKLHQNFISEISKINCIRGFSKVNGNILLEYHYNGELFIAINKSGTWKRMKIDVKNNFSTATFGVSESLDSFISFDYPEEDDQNLVLYEYIQ